MFKAQEAANVLWSLATLNHVAPLDTVRALLSCTQQAKAHELRGRGQNQLHQYFLFNSVCARPLELGAYQELAQLCQAKYRETSLDTHRSWLQREVARTLRKMGISIAEEEILAGSGLSVDMRLVGTKVVVEVDGPMHYVQDLGRTAGGQVRWNGSTRLKHRLLTGLGYGVVHIPYFEWQRHIGPARTDYLRTLLAPFLQLKP